MTYAKEINFPGGTSYTVTDFDPSSVLGKPYTVSSPDEELAHAFQPITVTCINCDKPDEGTAAALESRGWWLRNDEICSIECLFALADAITARVDVEGCPF